MFGNISKDSCGLIELSVRMQGKKQKGGGSGSASGFLVPLQLSDDLVKFIGTVTIDATSLRNAYFQSMVPLSHIIITDLFCSLTHLVYHRQN
uniref:Uncharacterized protein n=1 Tax=Leersia perrieri TaxID=77586 RepID=A0A0D9XC57_9ORYZ